eukprot:NODE_32_length_37098_cov_1.132760.p12 type:complete len:252 gc:universal NODE_32_length_37098_cov_1.132760:28706-27951(-)
MISSWIKAAKDYYYPTEGNVFLITGASRGIGKSIAIELAKKRKILVLVARNEKNLINLREELRVKYNIPVYSIVFDVTEFDGIQKLLLAAHKLAGPIDTIILNAGILSVHKIDRSKFSKDLSIIETNLLGPIGFINEYVTYAKNENVAKPHIVIITSIAADVTLPKMGAYSASKAGLSIYLESCILELESQGFSFTNIKPGFIRSDMTGHLNQILMYDSEKCAKEILIAMKFRQFERYVPQFIYWPLGTGD